MGQRYTARRWSLELAPGWSAATRGDSSLGERTEFVAITPPTDDALLRLTVDERGIIPAQQWAEQVAHISRAKGRDVSMAQCGDFRGWLVEFGSDDEWLRGWMLHRDRVPLDIVYRCKVQHTSRDNTAVGQMLGSLRYVETSAA